MHTEELAGLGLVGLLIGPLGKYPGRGGRRSEQAQPGRHQISLAASPAGGQLPLSDARFHEAA